MLFEKLNWSSYHTMLDFLIPKNILNRDCEIDYFARRNLLQARAVVTVMVSALIALVIQLVLDFYSSHESTKNALPYIAWPFSLIGTLIYAAILCSIPSGKITISQAAKIGIYFFLSISAYASCIGNGSVNSSGIQTLIHANFFVVPPFGLWKTDHDITFFRSIGRELNPISLSSSGWVLCDVYILCFIYFLFVAYEQEFQSNQEQTQKSLDEARSAATAKSMFISNVSHELRTPLHGILATVEILAKTQLSESQRTLLNAIESCGTNLISVVNQVLTYARIEHGKLELERDVFDIYTVMQEIGDGLAPIPERKNLDFFVFVEIDPLQRFLVGDVGVLRQIILNLLGNAIKFTDKGRIEFITIQIADECEEDRQRQLKETRISKELETIKNPSSASFSINSPKYPKVKLEIEVRDTGHGIAPEFMSLMFQPFSQEDSTLRRKFEGTGLGLSIVKGLLDMMHSQLEVDSELEQGSKFSFKLELPISERLDDMYPSSLPFDHKYLKLSPSEQETLINRLRSLSYVVLNLENFLLSKQIKHYLDQWGFNYRLTSKDKLKFECTKQHADIVILNDSLSYLECFLNEFTQYYRKPEKTVRKEFVKDGATGERQQRVLFFSTIEGHQKAESLLMKYKSQSAIIVTKPAGPVKILTAITKATESLFRKSKDTSLENYGDIVKAQEEKKRLTRKEYIDFIKNSNSNKFGTMDIGPGGELTISPSRLTPPAMFERIISGVNGGDKGRSNMQIETKDKDESEIEKSKNIQKDSNDISFLIVEDNKINEMILTTMLKQSGYYNYDIANNGLEAVEHFTKKSYDIIFMDLQMPICDGIVATKEIRKIERGEESHLLSPPTPKSPDGTSMEEAHKIGRVRKKKAIIIAMTGLASNEDSQVAEAAGCNEFLTKPVSIKSLNARMENWIKEVLKAEAREENESPVGKQEVH